MTGMNKGERQAAQALERTAVVVCVRVPGIVDECPIINNIAAEEDTGFEFIQRNRAGRVTRHMENLEGTVTGVHDIPLVEKAGERSRCDREVPQFITFARQGSEKLAADPSVGAGAVIVRILVDGGFGAMAEADVKFSGTANVVEMPMRRNGHHRTRC